VDFDDVLLERGYDGMKAYTQSKLAQVMFTFDMAERLWGTGVTTNALHPATLMDTKMVLETLPRFEHCAGGGRGRGAPRRLAGAGGGHGPLL